jgi:sugar phosphate isomerase/epimerase
MKEKDRPSKVIFVFITDGQENASNKYTRKQIFSMIKDLKSPDRGDQINWDRISSALHQVKYDGEVVIESFIPDIEMIAKAASIWRQFEPSQEDIAIKGLKFLKSCLIK